MSEPTDELAQFRSIKRVKAGEITEVLRFGCYVRNADGSVLLRGYPPDMTARYTPVVGDYWVIYDDDGYQSISPKAAFEAGYVATAAFEAGYVATDELVTIEGATACRSYAGIFTDFLTSGVESSFDNRVAILNMDGSIWCDWLRMKDIAATTGAKPENLMGVIWAQAFMALRGKLPEVSRERSEEIALEYGAKLLG